MRRGVIITSELVGKGNFSRNMGKKHAKHAKRVSEPSFDPSFLDVASKKQKRPIMEVLQEAREASDIREVVRSERERAWCFTINNPTKEDIAIFPEITCARYLVYGNEQGELNGTPHLQGFIYFKDNKTMSAVKKILPRAHLSVKAAFSKFSEAIGYCKKGSTKDIDKSLKIDGGWGKFATEPHEDWRGFEAGTPPMDPVDKGETEKLRFQNAWNLAKLGQIEEIDPDIRLRHLSALEKVSRTYAPVPITLQGELEHEWHTGPSGSGKSFKIRDRHAHNVLYIKGVHKWWDRYNGQPFVLIDEWPLDAPKELQHLLKTWSDRYAFDAEVKGGSCVLRPEKIYVTSNYTMEECFSWDNQGLYEPLVRRFKEIRHTGKFDWYANNSSSCSLPTS